MDKQAVNTTGIRPKAVDQATLGVAIVLGIVAIGWTIVNAVVRVLEIIPNRDVPVTAVFADTPATMSIGPGGQQVQVVADRVTMLVSDMPTITVVSLILAAIVPAVATVATVVCVCLILRNLIRGRAFVPSTVVLVGVATFTVAFGWILTWLFTTMGANGGAAALSDGEPQNTAFPLDFVTAFAIASLGGLAVAFQSGHRLQRDADGLV